MGQIQRPTFSKVGAGLKNFTWHLKAQGLSCQANVKNTQTAIWRYLTQSHPTYNSKQQISCVLYLNVILSFHILLNRGLKINVALGQVECRNKYSLDIFDKFHLTKHFMNSIWWTSQLLEKYHLNKIVGGFWWNPLNNLFTEFCSMLSDSIDFVFLAYVFAYSLSLASSHMLFPIVDQS